MKNINIKKLLFLLAIGFALISITSCIKEPPINYVEVPEETPTNDPWDYGFVDGGTLPNGGAVTNDLVGTQWVLTKMVSAFATEYPNDTIDFVNTTQYTLNNGAVRNYQLGTIPASTNMDLSLYYFSPFGGSHYSGQVGLYFVDDAEINNVEFEDVQNPSSTIRAWFIKL